MTTRAFISTVTYQLKISWPGGGYEYTPAKANWQRVHTKYKSSVDAGCFIPGQYRVNPYIVYEEMYQADEFLHISSKHQVGTILYIHTEDGPAYKALDFARALAPAPTDFGNLPARTLSAAMGKVGKSEAAMGENLGELRETLNMLRNPFKNLRDFLTNINHRNLGILQRIIHYEQSGIWLGRKGRKLGKQAADAAAGAWMEYRYGFRPLIMSIQDLVELANKQAMGLFDPTKIRSKRSKMISTSETELLPFNQAAGQIMCKHTPLVRDVREVFASVQYTQSAPNGVLRDLGLTPAFAPELLWELTRLSFVVDWAFEVGAWLATMRINPHITVLGNAVGQKIQRTITLKSEVHHSVGGIYDIHAIDVGGSYTYRGYERKVNQSLPLLPQFTAGDTIDLFRTIDSLAIIWQVILPKLTR